ncbi:CD276 antigen homolog [Carassius auratus]|uniref:CD276 antigen homolog n=1 Tax=Carassius auratus TaxID=7957 RepID=A0A6P6M7S5_CARAU|nr:CD276 antigen homolog [Carassius auratus]
MIIGWCFICIFAVVINEVSLDVTLVGFTGSSVVLPCSSTEYDLELQDINVFWRYNGSETIYDLISGKDSVAGQNPRYKNRAQTFPDEYLRGNFSIKLINLTHADAGEFSCFIIHSSDSKQETVLLFINESTVQKGNDSTEPAETKSDQWNIFIICVCILVPVIIFLSTACFMILCRKRPSAPL